MLGEMVSININYSLSLLEIVRRNHHWDCPNARAAAMLHEQNGPHRAKHAPSSMLPQPRAPASSKTGHDRGHEPMTYGTSCDDGIGRGGPRAHGKLHLTASTSSRTVRTSTAAGSHGRGGPRTHGRGTDLARRRPWSLQRPRSQPRPADFAPARATATAAEGAASDERWTRDRGAAHDRRPARPYLKCE